MEKGDTSKIYKTIALLIVLGLFWGSLIVLFLIYVIDIDIRSNPTMLLLAVIGYIIFSAIIVIFEATSLHKSKSEKEQSLFKFAMILAKFIVILVGLQMLIILIFYGLALL
jgi:hypothetical protein